MQFESKLGFGDKVYIDEDESLIATVVALKFFWQDVGPIVEIAYVHQGKSEYALVEEPRLTKIAIN